MRWKRRLAWTCVIYNVMPQKGWMLSSHLTVYKTHSTEWDTHTNLWCETSSYRNSVNISKQIASHSWTVLLVSPLSPQELIFHVQHITQDLRKQTDCSVKQLGKFRKWVLPFHNSTAFGEFTIGLAGYLGKHFFHYRLSDTQKSTKQKLLAAATLRGNNCVDNEPVINPAQPFPQRETQK